MATTLEMHVGELLERKRAVSGVAKWFRSHRTLAAGVLYALAITAVLAFVARL
jgi:hypothetical protein